MSAKTFNLIILPILSICCLSSCNNQQENNSNNNEDSTYFENGFIPETGGPAFPSYLAYKCQKEYKPDEQLVFTIFYGHANYDEYYSYEDREIIRGCEVTLNLSNNGDSILLDTFGEEFHSDDYEAYIELITDSSGNHTSRKHINNSKEYILPRTCFKDSIGSRILFLDSSGFKKMVDFVEIFYLNTNDSIKIIDYSEFIKLTTDEENGLS